MVTRTVRAPLLSILAIAIALLAFPVGASAADPAAVTITACKNDALTLAGKVAVTGKSVRKARGAVLQLRFQALALFGLPRSADWKVIGKRLKGSDQQAFTGLSANNWIGVLSWRFKKGSKTVLAGDVRSQPVKVGSSKGKADCTLAEGLKPVDATPPQLFILPGDELWHRAPTPVQLSATDDFSGVQSVRYSLDGGPITAIPNGSTFTIAAEGAHTVDFAATDVAGNTAQRQSVVRVDAAPPTKPAVTSPPSVTANRTPTISWTASSDTGSGVRGYVVTIQRADGSVVSTINADPNTTSVSAPTLDDNQNYVATVTAVDNTAGSPWATNSDPYNFRVDSSAEVASVTPPSGTILSGSAKDTNFTLTLDRPADPATVAAAVKLTRNSESGSNPAATIGCANNPCTQITIDPSGTLPEGRYTVTVNGLKSAGEGTPFQPFSGAYSVAFLENAAGVDPGTNGICVSDQALTATSTVSTTAPGETGVLDFDWSYGSGPGWTAQAFDGATPIGNQVAGSSGSGHSQLQFPMPQGAAKTITFKFTSLCSAANNSAKLDTSNLVGARTP